MIISFSIHAVVILIFRIFLQIFTTVQPTITNFTALKKNIKPFKTIDNGIFELLMISALIWNDIDLIFLAGSGNIAV